MHLQDKDAEIQRREEEEDEELLVVALVSFLLCQVAPPKSYLIR